MPKPWEAFSAGETRESLILGEGLTEEEKASLGGNIGGPLSPLNALAQGLSFGTADEVDAALSATALAPFSEKTWPQIYREQLERAQAQLFQGRVESPVASAGMEVIGAGTSGIRAGTALANRIGSEVLSRIPALAQLAGIGAIEGGIYGATTADPGERLEGAATGAAIGTVLTPVGAGLVRGGTALTKRLLAPLGRAAVNSPRTQAVRNVIQALDADDLTPAEAMQRLQNLGPEAILADLGPNAQATARALAGQQSRARSIAHSFLQGRQRGQQTRLMSELIDIDPRDFRRGFLQFVNNRQTASKPLYDRAFSTGLQVDDTLQALLNRPAMKSAMRRAARNMLDEGGGYSQLRLIDQAKQVLDDDIGVALRQGRNNRARILTQLKHEVLDNIDNQLGGGNPANSVYRQARELFSGEAQMRSAAQLGRNVLRRSTDLDAMEIALEGMSAGERDAFRSGVVRSVIDAIEGSMDNQNTAQRLIRSPRIRQAVRMAFPNDDAYQRFIQTAESESIFKQTMNTVQGGSRTAEFLSDIDNINRTSGVLQAATHAGNDPISSGINMLRTLGFGDASPETLEEMAKLMFSRGRGLSAMRRYALRSRVELNRLARDMGVGGVAASLPGATTPERPELTVP